MFRQPLSSMVFAHTKERPPLNDKQRYESLGTISMYPCKKNLNTSQKHDSGKKTFISRVVELDYFDIFAVSSF